MKFPRLPHLRTAKFAPLAVFFLFFATNVTGLYFSPVFAPVAQAAIADNDLAEERPNPLTGKIAAPP